VSFAALGGLKLDAIAQKAEQEPPNEKTQAENEENQQKRKLTYHGSNK
jgi:hypothetical protein